MDMVCKERDMLGSSNGSEENKLELTLGPPGENRSSLKQHQQDNNGHDDSLLSLGRGTIKVQKISSFNDYSGSTTTKPWPISAKFLQFPSNSGTQGLPALGKESLQDCNNSTKIVELESEKSGFSPTVVAKPAVPNTSQKRTAPAPVVGWPPIRSFRKNVASTSSKPSLESQNDNVSSHGKRAIEPTPAKGLFVKINMDGIPIGRKLDLNAYDSYEKLSSAVDKLFRGLFAAQTDSFANGIPNNLEMEKPITGLLDGSGEYTLVYEDNEGDRVLVGDVPWKMFVSNVKRLRVLKTSELPSLSLGRKQLDSPR
ncbi:unnamed protein product [Rhodiola kirilowii]